MGVGCKEGSVQESRFTGSLVIERYSSPVSPESPIPL